MKKILSKIRWIFTVLFSLLLLSLAAWGYLRFHQNPTSSDIPRPYHFSAEALASLRLWPEDNPFPPEQTQVLLVGDELAQAIWKWRDEFNLELSQELSSPFKLGRMGGPNEGLHRLSTRLQLMPQIPKIVILMVGGAEGAEHFADLNQYTDIMTNLNLSLNPVVRTISSLIPSSTRIFYRPVKSTELKSTVQKFTGELFDYEYQRLGEIHYTLFRLELEHLIQYLQSQKKQVVLVTLPIKLQEVPQKDCLGALPETQKKELQELWAFLKSGNTKDAIQLMEQVNFNQFPGASAAFLRALLAQTMGDMAKAKEHYLMSSALDCRLWRANHTTNSIVRKLAEENDVPLFDYEQWHNLDFGKNELFITPTLPQPYYLEKGAKAMGRALRTFLRP